MPRNVPVLLLAVLLAGCVEPNAAREGQPQDGVKPLRADIHIYARIPRDVEDEHNFTIRIESPDGVLRTGSVGTVAGIESRTRTSGDFRPEAPSTASPYAYTVFDDVAYNGNWSVDIVRTQNEAVVPPVIVAGEVNACAYIGFSDPDRTLRIFEGESSHELRDKEGWAGFSDARLSVEYGNWTSLRFERRPNDTCAA